MQCIYCDSEVNPGDNKCSVCNSNIDREFMSLPIHSNVSETTAKDRLSSNIIFDNTKGELNKDRIKTKMSPETKRTAGQSVEKSVARSTVHRNVDTVLPGAEPVRENVIARSMAPQLDEASWTCSKCTFLNKPDHLCCDVCYAENVTTKSSDKSNDGLIEPLEKLWCCPSCKFNNRSNSSRCEKCLDMKVTGLNDEGINRPQDDIITVTKGGGALVDHETASTNWRTWKCMHCAYYNTILALRCFSCTSNNQIYRICTDCRTYFILNDTDDFCLECISKMKVGTLCDNILPESKLQESISSEVVQKPTDKKGILRKKMFSSKTNKWICNNPSCILKSKQKGDSCTMCGTSSTTVDNKISRKGSAPEVVHHGHKEAAKKVLSPAKFFSNIRLKSKPWYCSDKTCRSDNKGSTDKCRACQRERYTREVRHSLSNVSDRERNSTINISLVNSSKYPEGGEANIVVE